METKTMDAKTTNSVTVLPEAVAQSFLRAINRHDVDALLALMSAEHCFIDGLGNRMEGLEKLRNAWTGYFSMVPDYAVAIDETLRDGPVVVMLGKAQGTFTRDGKLQPENRWETPVALRAFVEEGKVSEWRVYADNEPIRTVIANG
jgi:ketosteroid isomerase-like protein